jgi:hypothetical protein
MLYAIFLAQMAATTFTRVGTRDELLTQGEAGEQAWRASRKQVTANRRVAGYTAVALACTGIVYGYLRLTADSLVKAVIAVEREYFEPEGVRASDPSAVLEQFAELDTRSAFAGGDKASQAPATALEPAFPTHLVPESDL